MHMMLLSNQPLGLLVIFFRVVLFSFSLTLSNFDQLASSKFLELSYEAVNVRCVSILFHVKELQNLGTHVKHEAIPTNQFLVCLTLPLFDVVLMNTFIDSEPGP